MSPSPVITNKQREAVIEKARTLRVEMADVRGRLASASLSLTESLRTADPEAAVNRLYVVKLLESLPGVGKIQARRVMSEIGIAEKCLVVELGVDQRAALMTRFGQ